MMITAFPSKLASYVRIVSNHHEKMKIHHWYSLLSLKTHICKSWYQNGQKVLTMVKLSWQGEYPLLATYDQPS